MVLYFCRTESPPYRVSFFGATTCTIPFPSGGHLSEMEAKKQALNVEVNVEVVWKNGPSRREETKSLKPCTRWRFLHTIFMNTIDTRYNSAHRFNRMQDSKVNNESPKQNCIQSLCFPTYPCKVKARYECGYAFRRFSNSLCDALPALFWSGVCLNYNESFQVEFVPP